MAGRKQKNNADWFSHSAKYRDSDMMMAVRAEHGLLGYAVVCCLREILSEADYFKIKWTDIKQRVVAGQLVIERKQLIEIVDTCLEIGILQLDDQNNLYSDELIEDMMGLISKRTKIRETRNGETQPPAEPICVAQIPTNGDLCSTNTQEAAFVEHKCNTVHNIRVNNITEEKSNVSTKEGNNLKNLSLSSMTAENSQKPPSSGGERETFFDFLEIFFFRRLPCPVEETQRFIDHYEKTGWRDANGNPIKSRAAAARTWQPKKGEKGDGPPRGALSKEFVDAWEEVYQRAKLITPEYAHLLLFVRHVAYNKDEIVVTLFKREGGELTPIWRAGLEAELRPLMLAKFPLPVRSKLSKV